MKTVVFIDKESEGIWQSYFSLSHFLDGWRRVGLFEICSWRPSARSMRAAVPTLAGILGDETDWVAVVCCDLRGEVLPDGSDEHFDNPFDFADCYDASEDEAVVESPHAIVRLAQMLGGIPDKVRIAEDDVDKEEDQLVSGDYQSFEYPQSDGHYDLMERYRSGLPRPRRIICVSPRSYDSDRYRSLARELEQNDHKPVIDSGFWARNNYPETTRFVVYDWQEGPVSLEEDRDDAYLVSREDVVDAKQERHTEAMHWLSYWAGVLTLLTGNLSSAELKPYRLYRIEPRITDVGIRDSIAPRWSEWKGVCSQIEDQIKLEEVQLRRSELEEQEIPYRKTPISVLFDLKDGADLTVNSSLVRLFRDRPQNDLEVWKGQQRNSSSALQSLLRAPHRSIARAVKEFRRVSAFNVDELEYCVLTENQHLDLVDDLVTEEMELARSTGRRAFRMESHASELDSHSKDVFDAIETRPPIGIIAPALGWMVAAALLGLAACLPGMFLVEDAAIWNLGIIVGSVVGLVIPAILLIASQLEAVRAAYEAFNKWIQSVRELLEDEAERLSKRLTLYAGNRKGWQIANRQTRLSEPTHHGAWLHERLAHVVSRMTDAALIAGEPDVKPDVVAQMEGSPWSQVSLLVEDESFFDAVPSRCVERPFNPHLSDYRKVPVPFEFVESVTLTDIRVH